KSSLGEEGYILEIKNEGLFLQAATSAGLFYGIQTLRQILPASLESSVSVSNGIELPQLYIKDVPRYSWRGTMVDISRSFFDLQYLKDHVDRMALYKMNRLHLHLTDDQGWRIEIKSKPELTNQGSKGAVEGGRSGYLTQDEYLELQTYAAARNIIIIPEIDMPGHIYSALLAYPELNCDEYSNIEPRMATPPELFSGTKVGWSKLCLTKPEIYDFVADVIGEMAAMTTGPWIHIGGDEIEDDLYETFVVKADSIVRQTGKISIGWEEVTKAPVSSSLISQQWHGKVESVVDVKVIESICSSFYFDHANIPGQEETNNWCKKSGVTLEEVYNFSSENENVLGLEAPVWTEFVHTDEAMDNRFWPRTIAVAELAWSENTSKDYEEFISRLKKHEERLTGMGINYYPAAELGWNENTNIKRMGVFKGFLPGKNANTSL
ncbi:MAG TPA: family 20 glycosylhydrolase, partial [Gillisia sp.]|nr:family 20 glycosylhydrolase [Gillisia sp.]